MATINDFVIALRDKIRDNGIEQAFPDVYDNSATPRLVSGSSPELQRFVKDAVMEYSRYRPRKRQCTLNLAAGITEYTLPADWMMAAGEMELLTSSNGIIKLNWYDDDQKLILSQAPLVSESLRFDYYAVHQVDANGSTIPRQWEDAAMLPAGEKALRAIAADQAVKLQKYKIASTTGFEVDNTKSTEYLLQLADRWRREFLTEVVLKPYGTMGAGDR